MSWSEILYVVWSLVIWSRSLGFVWILLRRNWRSDSCCSLSVTGRMVVYLRGCVDLWYSLCGSNGSGLKEFCLGCVSMFLVIDRLGV